MKRQHGSEGHRVQLRTARKLRAKTEGRTGRGQQHVFFRPNAITILDPGMAPDSVRFLPQSLKSVLGVSITNKTGIHLFIEVRPSLVRPTELVIRLSPV